VRVRGAGLGGEWMRVHVRARSQRREGSAVPEHVSEWHHLLDGQAGWEGRTARLRGEEWGQAGRHAGKEGMRSKRVGVWDEEPQKLGDGRQPQGKVAGAKGPRKYRCLANRQRMPRVPKVSRTAGELTRTTTKTRQACAHTLTNPPTHRHR